MFSENVSKVLEMIPPTARVLDIGGWAMPFNRANWVLDIGDYTTRGMFGAQGPVEEHFSSDTWITRDLCDKTPYPFQDKYFDFVICSHTLEDIRDPIWVCSEINRIGRAGYIELPSPVSELSLGVENRNYAGRYHHRWLTQLAENNIIFTQKCHNIHSFWKYHFPASYYQATPPERRIHWMFWVDSFSFRENLLITHAEVDRFFLSLVQPETSHSHGTVIRERIKDALRSLMKAPRARDDA